MANNNNTDKSFIIVDIKGKYETFVICCCIIGGLFLVAFSFIYYKLYFINEEANKGNLLLLLVIIGLAISSWVNGLGMSALIINAFDDTDYEERKK